MKTTPVIAIANQKGGVAKTTSTVNIASALVAKGKRVLVIDIDPQASLTIYLGRDPRALHKEGKTLEHCLMSKKPLSDIIVSGEAEQPDLIASSINLAKMEAHIAADLMPALVLKGKLAPLRESGGYDFILLDCPPTLTFLAVNALSAASAVLIPVKTDYLSIMGIPQLLETVEEIKTRANPHLTIFGVLPTMFNAQNRHDNDALKELTDAVSSQIRVFGAVRRSTGFDKAAAENVATLARYPDTPGVEHYQLIGDSLIETYATREI